MILLDGDYSSDEAQSVFSLPTAILEEYHKLSRGGSTIVLLEIPEHDIRLAQNLEDVTWDGKTWQKFWFEFEAVEDATADNVPEVQVSTSNVGGQMEAAIIAHDNFEESTCIIRFINSNCLEETTPVAQITFQVMKPIVNNLTAALKLSVDNPLLLSYPTRKYHGSLCQVTFKGDLCGYAGPDTTCSGTITACLAKGNQKRFGAQLGLSDDYVDLDD